MDQSNQPLQLADGREYLLISEIYSPLQGAIIEKFGPYFAPGAVVLYNRDILSKVVIYERGELEKLGIAPVTLDELPDIILYHAVKDRLYFIEAGIIHQAITLKRRRELERISKNCKAARIFVSAFPNFNMYRKHAANIAWNSCVWLATNPEHTIYYDGQESFAVHG